jgi:hypothetical protein
LKEVHTASAADVRAPAMVQAAVQCPGGRCYFAGEVASSGAELEYKLA